MFRNLVFQRGWLMSILPTYSFGIDSRYHEALTSLLSISAQFSRSAFLNTLITGPNPVVLTEVWYSEVIQNNSGKAGQLLHVLGSNITPCSVTKMRAVVISTTFLIYHILLFLSSIYLLVLASPSLNNKFLNTDWIYAYVSTVHHTSYENNNVYSSLKSTL